MFTHNHCIKKSKMSIIRLTTILSCDKKLKKCRKKHLIQINKKIRDIKIFSLMQFQFKFHGEYCKYLQQ